MRDKVLRHRTVGAQLLLVETVICRLRVPWSLLLYTDYRHHVVLQSLTFQQKLLVVLIPLYSQDP